MFLLAAGSSKRQAAHLDAVRVKTHRHVTVQRIALHILHDDAGRVLAQTTQAHDVGVPHKFRQAVTLLHDMAIVQGKACTAAIVSAGGSWLRCMQNKQPNRNGCSIEHIHHKSSVQTGQKGKHGRQLMQNLDRVWSCSIKWRVLPLAPATCPAEDMQDLTTAQAFRDRGAKFAMDRHSNISCCLAAGQLM
jgi:hypothetical protein